MPQWGSSSGWNWKKAVLAIFFVWLLIFGLGFVSHLIVGVDPGELAILIRKSGDDLSAGEVAATGSGQKGIHLETLPEGWHLINPYVWDWQVVKQTEVPAGKVGVRVRMFGADPSSGVGLAEEGQKGIMREILKPGRYPINTMLYQVWMYDAVNVPSGFAGVVTLLNGRDPKNPNVFVVESGERGTQPTVLPPGTYYLNPFETRVDNIDTRSHRFDMMGDDVIQFPSSDGFPITMEATVEWQIEQTQIAKVFVVYVDSRTYKVLGDAQEKIVLECIVEKVILPNARAFGRIEGSKYRARDFISGESRQQFQDRFLLELEKSCARQGILIKSALVRQIEPPKAIADPIRAREIAVRQREKYEEQKLREKQQKQLAMEVKLQDRMTQLKKAEADVAVSITQANRVKGVALIAANRKLEVARLELEAAKNIAAAIVSRGQAEADVIRFNNSAEAGGLRAACDAFGSGDSYVRYLFQQRIAPTIRSILTNTEGPFVDIFRDLARPGAQAAPADAGKTPPERSGAPVKTPPDETK